MNARTTTLLTVLALALAACVAPMPAPPVKAPTVPEMEQPVLIPSTQTEQRQTLPAVTDPQAYPDYVPDIWKQDQQKVKDEAAARLLVAQKTLTDKLMTGLPMQIREYVEVYAAIKVAEMETAPSAATSSTAYPDILQGVLEGRMTTTPYVLPEQTATNPKQPAMQELDDMLKPVPMPENLTAAKIAMLEHGAIGVPTQVQQAIANYIEDLKLPASTMPARDQWYLEEQTPAVTPAKDFTWENSFDKWYLEEMGYVQTVPMPENLTAAKIAMLEHWAVGAPPEAQQAIANYIEDLKLPASTMPVRDQWYLETP